MQFTPQQLTGGPKFHHKCRIGNWSEDLELEEIKLKDYLKKKEMGGLLVNAKQQRLEESLKETPLTQTAADGFLRFGMQVMLLNHQSEGFLAGNAHDKLMKSADAYAATTGPNSNGCVRNVYTIERADPSDGFEDDMLHYGQSFRLSLEPFADILSKAYLHSECVSYLAAAKFSRHQEVVMYAGQNGNTLWQLLHPDTQQRFEKEGFEVPAGEPVCIRHVQTGSFLASDKIAYNNIFGLEFEVHCHHYYSTNKTQNLTSEKKGEITGDYQLRRHGLPNIWTVVTG